MLLQLFIGSATTVVTMAVMVSMIALGFYMLHRAELMVKRMRFVNYRFIIILSISVAMVLLANTICVWIWTMLFWWLNMFTDLEETVYFVMVSFTTAGYGDVVAGKEWRILTGFVGINGLLAFGIYTAFLIEILRTITEEPPKRR